MNPVCDKCGCQIDPNDEESALCLKYWDLCPDCREEELDLMFEALEGEEHAHR